MQTAQRLEIPHSTHWLLYICELAICGLESNWLRMTSYVERKGLEPGHMRA
jgi:hypothetical protein